MRKQASKRELVPSLDKVSIYKGMVPCVYISPRARSFGRTHADPGWMYAVFHSLFVQRRGWRNIILVIFFQLDLPTRCWLLTQCASYCQLANVSYQHPAKTFTYTAEQV